MDQWKRRSEGESLSTLGPPEKDLMRLVVNEAGAKLVDLHCKTCKSLH